MVSVIIAAHNEARLISATLEALLAQPELDALDVVVSANGCTDRTAEIARSYGVHVIDRPEPGKAGALNEAEKIMSGFPRIYLDADIVIPPNAIAAILAQFDGGSSPLAVVPRRRINTSLSPWPVKCFYAINERLPVYRRGLFGRGLIALSETARARFDAFPPLVADDLFVDSLFHDSEKAEARDVVIVVDAPRSTKGLMSRLIRLRRGNAQMRAAMSASDAAVAIRQSDKWAWLRDVVAKEPRLAFAAVPYVTITLIAGFLARRSPSSAWGRDNSTR